MTQTPDTDPPDDRDYVEAGVDPEAIDPEAIDPDGVDRAIARAEDGDPTATPAAVGPVVARPSNDYRVRRYLMCALLFGAGLYFLYDGYVGWPAKNARIAEVQAAQEAAAARSDSAEEVRLGQELKALGDPKSDLSILIQKLLGFGLPPLALAYLVYTLRASRGEYRLDEDDVLHVPGHPPVPLSAVTGVDRGRWDRKGIAKVDYEAGGRAGTLTLDDFIYQREPTDAIYDRVLASPGAAASRAAIEAT